MKRPLAAAGTVMLTAMAVMLRLGGNSGITLTLLCAAVCLIFIVCGKRLFATVSLLVCAIFAFCSLSLSFYRCCRFLPSESFCGMTCTAEGTADSFCEPYTAEKNLVILKNCRIDGKETPLRVGVYFPQDFSCAYGDTVSAQIFIFERDKDDTMGDHPDRVFLYATARGGVTVRESKSHSPVYYAKYAQKKLGAILDRNMTPEHAGITKALLLGDKSTLNTDFKEQLRISGASHIFAVSGMHLSLWSAILFLILHKRSRTKLLPNAAVALFVLFYMALTGFSPSVIRAGIMLITVLAGFCFRHPADPINSLGLSALILLTVDPLTAVDISFLLSFNATAALFILYPYFEQRDTVTGGKLKRLAAGTVTGLRNTVRLSLCVLLFTVPISACFFGTVSLLSPISSILCSLPAECLMTTSAAALLLSPIRTVSRWTFRLPQLSAQLIQSIIATLGRSDFAVCTVDTRLTALWYPITALIVFTVWYFSGKRIRRALTSLLLCVSLLLGGCITASFFVKDRIYLHLEAEERAYSITVYTRRGNTAALIFDSAAMPTARMTEDYLNRSMIGSIDTLIVPTGDSEKTAAELRGIITIDPDTLLLPSLADKNDNFTCRVTDKIVYTSYSTDDLCAGLLTCGGSRTVISYYAGADHSLLPDEYKHADILICRSQIPAGLSTADYGTVIVVTDRADTIRALPANAFATADKGNLTIEFNSKENRYAIDR